MIMGRLKPLSKNALNDEQRLLLSAITGGKRSSHRAPGSFFLEDGGLRGPFNAWLHAPAVGHPAQRLGEAVRFETGLDPALRELAILTVAATWRADYEWWAHRTIALEAGLPEATVEAIKQGELPDSAAPAARVVYDFSKELLGRHRVDEHTYRLAADALGDRGVVELVAVLGYYTLVSMTLNAFEVGMPKGATRPFD